ncbi:hypothetical protein PoB_002277500 [Plakobranchus ocellatus]|uniref:Uncharacterized protein n=1 Tax=Plakobranchus ocellatus TaxID=259542 RepID=A0AAV3ZMA5_9GAST|nr:hypothetical protein PoB_002277500 [Plakobranchus ocellatus]
MRWDGHISRLDKVETSREKIPKVLKYKIFINVMIHNDAYDHACLFSSEHRYRSVLGHTRTAPWVSDEDILTKTLIDDFTHCPHATPFVVSHFPSVLIS